MSPTARTWTQQNANPSFFPQTSVSELLDGGRRAASTVAVLFHSGSITVPVINEAWINVLAHIGALEPVGASDMHRASPVQCPLSGDGADGPYLPPMSDCDKLLRDATTGVHERNTQRFHHTCLVEDEHIVLLVMPAPDDVAYVSLRSP